mmetsp:Transcript_16319/g.46582  ORF Transcript_16319/g.46582 Transcript_16319/m.46582 type:complete len:207 (-) Transcript_16319:243-863(-)
MYGGMFPVTATISSPLKTRISQWEPTIEQSDVSWFSSSAPSRVSHPKYALASARTLGVFILTTQLGTRSPVLGTTQPLPMELLPIGHWQSVKPRSGKKSMIRGDKSRYSRPPLGSGNAYCLPSQLQRTSSGNLSWSAGSRRIIGVPSGSRKYLNSEELKARACASSWMTRETCSSTSSSRSDSWWTQKLIVAKIGRSHWSFTHHDA